MKNKGFTRDQIVSSVDIYPTLMDLCGIAMPHKTDGRSMAGLIQESGDPDWKNFAFSYYRRGISLRTERYRLTRYFRSQEPTIELYDHSTDPHENNNIAAKFPDEVKRLLTLWEKGNTGLFR